MNPDQPSREQIEARLTALLLDELPAEEAELLRWTISRDPELQKLHDQLKGTIGFVREAMKNPTGAPMDAGTPLKLPQDRRQTLLAHFKTARPQPLQKSELSWLKRIKVSPLIPTLVVIAILALLAAVLLPVLSASKSRALSARHFFGKSEAENSLQESYQKRSTYGASGSEETTISGRKTGSVAAKTPPTPAPIALPNTESAQAESDKETGQVYSQEVVGYVNVQVPAANSEIVTNQLSFPSREPIVAGDGGVASADQANTASWNLQEQSKSLSDTERTVNGPYEQKEFQNGVLATNYVANALPTDQPQAFYRFTSGQGGESGRQQSLATREIQNVNNGTGSFGGFGGSSTVPPVASTPALGLPTAPIPELPRSALALNEPAGNEFKDALTDATNGTPNKVQYFNFPYDESFAGNVTNTAAVDEARLNTYGNNLGLGNSPNSPQVASENQNSRILHEAMVSLPTGAPVSASVPPAGLDSAPPVPILAPPPPAAGQPDTARVGLSPRLQQFGPVGTGRDQPSYSELKKQLGESPERHEAEATKEPDDKTDIWRAPQSTAPVPQPEIRTSDNAFSTFSLNVSDVSFKLAMASLEKGQMPAPASIRSEEFINAFDYHDPEPLQGEPLAFVSERARDPFAQERDMLRFSIKAAAAGRQDGRELNLVLLLDTSGSMERADRVAIIREALRVLSAQLQPHDVVSVVTFARTARLWADGVPGGEASATFDKVGSITPDGGTNLEEAMRLAYETALRHFITGGMNRVVLLTDGAANLGNVDPQALTHKVDSERRQGIALDCFGIGWDDYNDDLLEQLSSNGDGRYAFINSPDEVRTEFAAKLAGALQVAAEDVKVQVEFNPNRVTSWRQIGYAKHQLTKQQFRDNTVAAGAIASREAGNALYTIEPKADGEGPIATVRVRYRVPGTQDVHERSWLVEYTGAAPELPQSSPAMRLAATAAETSEWMANSPFAQDVTPDELLNDLSGVPQIYGTDERPKQLEWMIREIDTLKR